MDHKQGESKNSKLKVLAIAGSISLTFATATWAQQSNPSNDQQMQNMPGMQMQNGQTQQDQARPKDSMTGGCHRHTQAMNEQMKGGVKTMTTTQSTRGKCGMKDPKGMKEEGQNTQPQS